MLAVFSLLIYASLPLSVAASDSYSKDEISKIIQQIFENRDKAILQGNLKLIESIYDKNTKYGTWAYQYEEKKMKYVHNWEVKQGAKFIAITPKIVVKSMKGNGNKLAVTFICSTEYKYLYEDDPDTVNKFRIGTNHIMQIYNNDGLWIIGKEWYKDPFADSLNINNLKAGSIRQYILSQSSRDTTNISKRRINAVDYADQYCGAASEEQYGFKYNKKYRDYNPLGGDCANFASQILFEGGKFRKNSAWNYDNKYGSRAWVNADGLKDYMIYSGRASVIAYGNYEKIYKSSYKLLSGDFIAYERKGAVTHISVVTGVDSKGYSLVSCHNTDRNRVPWDLGWSDGDIRFWLVHVNY